MIHPSAIVEEGAIIGDGAEVWHFAHVRAGARIGPGCVLGKGVFVDVGVRIGANVKVQNNVSVYHGVEIHDGAFVGPHVCFTNDMRPRAILPDGSPVRTKDWTVAPTVVGHGASLGANSTIRAGVHIGRWAMVGAGSVVTKDVPPYGLVYGNPARLRGVVAPTGEIVARTYAPGRYRGQACAFEVPTLSADG